MADIDVQRKGPTIWPFLLGAIVLGLLIWGLIQLFDRDEAVRLDAPGTTADTMAVPGAP